MNRSASLASSARAGPRRSLPIGYGSGWRCMSLTRAPRDTGDLFAYQGCPVLDPVLGRAPMRLAPTPLVHVGRLVSCARLLR